MHRTSSRVLLIVAAFVLLLVPVAAIAAGGFTDVDDGSVFKTDIDWLADAGVTKGCNPPANTEFCPGDNVTREQMSAFMHRLAVNKVVDAKSALTALTADHANEADVAATAGSAANADKLDGKDSTAFAMSAHDHDAAYLAKTGKATDSDKLDGLSSENIASRASMADYAGANANPSGEVRATVTIDVPANGILIANTTGDTWDGSGVQKCFLRVDGKKINASNGRVDHSQHDEADCIAGATVMVQAGSHTVELWFEGDADNDGTLTVLWVPFDGTGAVPTAAADLGSVELDEKDQK